MHIIWSSEGAEGDAGKDDVREEWDAPTAPRGDFGTQLCQTSHLFLPLCSQSRWQNLCYLCHGCSPSRVTFFPCDLSHGCSTSRVTLPPSQSPNRWLGALKMPPDLQKEFGISLRIPWEILECPRWWKPLLRYWKLFQRSSVSPGGKGDGFGFIIDSPSVPFCFPLSPFMGFMSWIEL